jgi:nucleoside-diphosphate-sugar epimerase
VRPGAGALRTIARVKLLFIGGTGIISTACVHRAMALGHEVSVLNRGHTHGPDLPDGVTRLVADAYDPDAVRAAMAGQAYDSVVQWVGFTPDHVERDIEVFADAGQYVFISSATVYRKPPSHYVITENTPLSNPLWPYAHNKILCEDRLRAAYAERGFPMTIVRPSHTYGLTQIPVSVGSWTRPYTIVDRMRRGAKIIIPGDGTSLWTVTHSSDFAVGLVGLLGHPDAVGEAVHITSDDVLSWNDIYAHVAAAAGVDLDVLHVPSDALAAAEPDLLGSLWGDKAHSLVFDNSKIRRLVPDFDPRVPFGEGIRDTVAWFDAHPSHQGIDEAVNELCDRVAAVYAEALRRVAP